MGALDLFFHTRWKDLTLYQKVILGAALIMFFLVGFLTILTLVHGILQWSGEGQTQETISHSKDTIVYVGASHFVDNELPKVSGNILTLEHAPRPPNSLKLTLNGLLMSEGKGNDYILTGNSINYTARKIDPWEQFSASYRY
jgi:hypothetical protein